MKNFKYIFLVLIFFCSCSTNKTSKTDNAENSKEPNRERFQSRMTFDKDDEGEYDLIVLDPLYEAFLHTIALPVDYYSESYYKTHNYVYVVEWNIRHARPMEWDPDFYEFPIDYNVNIHYGLLFEYKLYQFFKFLEFQYKVKF